MSPAEGYQDAQGAGAHGPGEADGGGFAQPKEMAQGRTVLLL